MMLVGESTHPTAPDDDDRVSSRGARARVMPNRRGPYAIWPLFGLSMLLAAGCGTSDAASAGSAGTPITKRQAVAYARAVNLRAGDIHGLRATGASHTAKGPLGTQAETCGITAPAGTVVGISSQTFQRVGAHTNASRSYSQTVFSVVYVMQSAAQASRAIAAVDAAANSLTVVTCLKHDVEDTRVEGEHQAGAAVAKPAGEPPIFSHVEVSALRSPVGAVQADGLQIKAHSAIEVPGAKGPFNFYTDWLGYAVGPGVTMLVDAATPRPFPAATERRLLSLLYRRAKAYAACRSHGPGLKCAFYQPATFGGSTHTSISLLSGGKVRDGPPSIPRPR
jgi:hypothetical protein